MTQAHLFQPENALEDALLAARENDDPDRFLAALAAGDVFVPSSEPGPDEERRVVSGPTLALPVVEHDGASWVPVFTSLRQLARFLPDGTGYVRLPGRALAAADTGVVVNPGGEIGLMLAPAQLARLGAAAAAAAEGEAELLIGEPREEPALLLDAMRRFAEGRPEVLAAYRALLVRRPGMDAEPVVGLELRAGADPHATVEAAAAAAAEAGVERLALLPFVPGVELDHVGRFLRERTRPFWVRN